jgi:hypothetical protein
MRASVALVVAIGVVASLSHVAAAGSAAHGRESWVVWKNPRLTLPPLAGWGFFPPVVGFGGVYRLGNDPPDGEIAFRVLARRVYSPRTHKPAIRRVDFLVWLQHHPLLQVGGS